MRSKAMISITITGTLLFLMAGCAMNRDAILSRTVAGVDAAYEIFKAGDERQQTAIILEGRAAGKTVADVDVLLAAHRAKRDKTQAVFLAAWSAIAAASIDLTDENMRQMGNAAAAALAAFRSFQ